MAVKPPLTYSTTTGRFEAIRSPDNIPEAIIVFGSVSENEVVFGTASGGLQTSSDFTYDGSDLVYSGSNNSPQFLGAGIESTRIGIDSASSGDYSVSIGESVTASGQDSIAIGNGRAFSTMASGLRGVAVGYGAIVTGKPWKMQNLYLY